MAEKKDNVFMFLNLLLFKFLFFFTKEFVSLTCKLIFKSSHLNRR